MGSDGGVSDGGVDKETTQRQAIPAFNSSSPMLLVLTFWRDLDLEKWRAELDDQGLRIGDNQENSLKNRRKLAESTRDFKKASNEEKAKAFPALLKGYQEEVDNLTKRAKFGENAFLNVYQKLYEAPDPVPALSSGAELATRLAELDSDYRKMKQELEEYRSEAAHLRNQQATVRRLEERNRLLEQQMEEKVKEIVEMKQRSLAEENQKNIEIIREREAFLQNQLRAAKESVQNMQRLHEYGQTQLFNLHAQSEEVSAAKQSELNLLTDEVDRSQARLLSLEREKEQLRSELQAVNNQEVHLQERLNEEASSNLEVSLKAKEKIISELHYELHTIESTLSNEREQHLVEVKRLNALLNEKDLVLQVLQKELSERPTPKQVEDLRKQVKILQAVGYNSVEAEDWEIATRGEDIGKLETLLLDKNRKMEHELTQFKVQLSERTEAALAAVEKVRELEAQVTKHKALIVKLEEDIVKGYGPSHDRRPTKHSDDWDLPDSGINDSSEQHESSKGVGGEDRNSMLQVICSQRDRFRQRLRVTEEELRASRDRCQLLTADVERSKADNVKLYEKMRFVQDYTKEGPVSRNKKRGEDLESGMGGDVESRYKKMYEDDINPFTAFSKKEKDRRYRELGLRDKITLTSGRFLLGNKFSSLSHSAIRDREMGYNEGS
ncbi:protein CASP isoform X3 [Physcomitrium patens]|uniref:Protein CASP n=2 Tax=Physcomitrium patens TaxID=3218 RepID=A0A7I4DFI3_PHYPA|nr:protein CASP-like isoform X3 [Physcomitrium patens]|eukprot:XP_024370891.1 protein CASP-like isoform X3 [Physcomitrella patens]